MSNDDFREVTDYEVETLTGNVEDTKLTEAEDKKEKKKFIIRRERGIHNLKKLIQQRMIILCHIPLRTKRRS